MKLFAILLAHGSLALKGSDLVNCKLTRNKLSAKKEYLNIATVPLTTGNCTVGECRLPYGTLSGCGNLSVLPTFIVKDKDEDQRKIMELTHRTKGKHTYKGINFDLSSFTSSGEIYFRTITYDLIKASTLTLDYENMFVHRGLTGLISSFKAVLIKNPDISDPVLDKNSDVSNYHAINGVRLTFIYNPNVYTIFTPEQFKNISSKLPNINVIFEEKKHIFPRQNNLNLDEPKEAAWYPIAHSKTED